MFKIFVIVFLASGGAPVGTSSGKTLYPTLEACQAELTTTDVNDPKSIAAYKAYAEQALSQPVRLAAACVEVGEDGQAVDPSQLPSTDEQ